MRKLVGLTAACMFLAASGSSHAMKLVGFDWGVNFLKPSDSRFDAYSTAFTLEIPIQKATIGYYHESVNIKGQDSNATTVSPSYITVNALRLTFPLANLKNQTGLPIAIEGLIDIGAANININTTTLTTTFAVTKPMGDVGFGVWYNAGSAYGVQANVGITALYRFLKVSPVALFGTGTSAVDDLGGFEVGFNMLIAY